MPSVGIEENTCWYYFKLQFYFNNHDTYGQQRKFIFSGRNSSGNKSWQMHLSLLFGSRLPYGLINSERHTATGRLSAYRRVDIGISKRLISPEKTLPQGNIFRHFKEMWLSLEVFNLLDINNTISYTWVTSITGEQYGVPNYLTGRRLNLKLIAKF